MAESIHESSDLTLDYYNRNAQRFTGDTLEVEFSNIQDSFLRNAEYHRRCLDS